MICLPKWMTAGSEDEPSEEVFQLSERYETIEHFVEKVTSELVKRAMRSICGRVADIIRQGGNHSLLELAFLIDTGGHLLDKATDIITRSYGINEQTEQEQSIPKEWTSAALKKVVQEDPLYMDALQLLVIIRASIDTCLNGGYVDESFRTLVQTEVAGHLKRIQQSEPASDVEFLTILDAMLNIRALLLKHVDELRLLLENRAGLQIEPDDSSRKIKMSFLLGFADNDQDDL